VTSVRAVEPHGIDAQKPAHNPRDRKASIA
jgi:hypothetical protein